MYIYFLGSSEKHNVQVKNCYGYLFGQLEEKVGLNVLSTSGHTGERRRLKQMQKGEARKDQEKLKDKETSDLDVMGLSTV